MQSVEDVSHGDKFSFMVEDVEPDGRYLKIRKTYFHQPFVPETTSNTAKSKPQASTTNTVKPNPKASTTYSKAPAKAKKNKKKKVKVKVN